MMRIAVLGANGQVGAEVCLILSRQPGVSVVPISRRRFGSAFLRFRGLACRHGDPSDPAQAAALLSDCDVIANFALAALAPDLGAAKAAHDALLDNSFRHSAPMAKHIYFSTMSVYGDRKTHDWVSFRSLYGAEKLRCERTVRKRARAFSKPYWIFRLGHVCGELQGLTRSIQGALSSGAVRLPDPERNSNVVFVQTIVDAILAVANGRIALGTFDLMNQPQWTWREVFEFEGSRIGRKPAYEIVEEQRRTFSGHIGVCATRGIASIRRSSSLRKLAERVAAHAPKSWSGRFRALYSIRSATHDIGRLKLNPEVLEATLRTPVMCRSPSGLTQTSELLSDRRYDLPPPGAIGVWPRDMAPAQNLQNIADDRQAAAPPTGSKPITP